MTLTIGVLLMVLPSNALTPAKGRTDLPVTASATDVEHPICFWNVVPWQEIGDRFEIGVLAFHDDGVDTSLSLDGGPFIDFDEASRNPRTMEYERWSRIDPAGFLGRPKIEVVARVQVRGTAHSIDFPLELFVTWGGPLAKAVVWADANTGDDILGDGSPEDPFRTLGRAVHEARVAGVERSRVMLRAGTYSFDHGDWIEGVQLNGPWFEIEGEDGAVIEEAAGFVPRGLQMRRVRLMGLEVRSSLLTAGMDSQALWLSGCTLSGPAAGSAVDFAPELSWPGGVWSTGCVFQTNAIGARGYRMVRSGYFIGVDEAMVDCPLVIDCDALLCDGTVCRPPRGRQFLVKSLRAFDCQGSGILLDTAASPETANDYRDGVIGSCVIEAETDALAVRDDARNILVWLNTFDGTVTFGKGSWQLCRFHGNSTSEMTNELVAGLDPEGWAFINNHFVDSSGSFLVPGSGAISGAAGYREPAVNDYSPSGPSALIQANPVDVYVDSDAFGNLRGGEGPSFATARGGIRGTDETTQ